MLILLGLDVDTLQDQVWNPPGTRAELGGLGQGDSHGGEGLGSMGNLLHLQICSSRVESVPCWQCQSSLAEPSSWRDHGHCRRERHKAFHGKPWTTTVLSKGWNSKQQNGVSLCYNHFNSRYVDFFFFFLILLQICTR